MLTSSDALMRTLGMALDHVIEQDGWTRAGEHASECAALAQSVLTHLGLAVGLGAFTHVLCAVGAIKLLCRLQKTAIRLRRRGGPSLCAYRHHGRPRAGERKTRGTAAEAGAGGSAVSDTAVADARGASSHGAGAPCYAAARWSDVREVEDEEHAPLSGRADESEEDDSDEGQEGDEADVEWEGACSHDPGRGAELVKRLERMDAEMRALRRMLAAPA